VAPDGSVLAGGAFTSFNGVAANRLVRLSPDGTIDSAFVTNIGTGASGAVLSVAAPPDGFILAGGSFTSFNGVAANRLVRLNPDGTIDTGFATSIGTGANGPVDALGAAPDGSIVAGGYFTFFNGTAANRLVRLAPVSLAIDPIGAQNGVQDVAVTVPVSAHTGTGDPAPVRFSATGLPPGVSIDASTGVISGSPTTPGTYAVTVTATRAPTLTVPLVVDTSFSWAVHPASGSAAQSSIAAAPAQITTAES
jgi:hypothetical protein